MRGAILLIVLSLIFTPVQANSGDRINLRIATRQAVPTVQSEKVTTRESVTVVKVLLMEVSAYSPQVCETDSDPLTMASGQRVRVGAIAADLSILPMHSLVRIPGYNNGKVCEVLDTGGSIRGLRLDIFLWSTHEAVHWGRRKNIPCEILRIGA